MKPTPIHLIVSRLKVLPLHHQIAHLRYLVSQERPYSVRHNELQSLLAGKLQKQLLREIRADRKTA